MGLSLSSPSSLFILSRPRPRRAQRAHTFHHCATHLVTTPLAQSQPTFPVLPSYPLFPFDHPSSYQLSVKKWVALSPPPSMRRPRPVRTLQLAGMRCNVLTPPLVYLYLGNDEIENQLKRDRMLAKNEIKMLLLGAGESGKVRPSLLRLPMALLIVFFFRLGEQQSTVLKQMKLIHHGGYNESERDSYKEIIFSNTIQSMRSVLCSFSCSLCVSQAFQSTREVTPMTPRHPKPGTTSF